MASPRLGNCWTIVPSSSAFDPFALPGGRRPLAVGPVCQGCCGAGRKTVLVHRGWFPLLCRPSRDCVRGGKPAPPGRQGRRQGRHFASPDKANVLFLDGFQSDRSPIVGRSGCFFWAVTAGWRWACRSGPPPPACPPHRRVSGRRRGPPGPAGPERSYPPSRWAGP